MYIQKEMFAQLFGGKLQFVRQYIDQLIGVICVRYTTAWVCLDEISLL